jgi:cytochrome P450
VLWNPVGGDLDTTTSLTSLALYHLDGDHAARQRLAERADLMPSATEVVLDRSPNPHMAFGVGPRRCIGMRLARALFRIMMRQVLGRIPDYRIDRQATTLYERNPALTGVVAMPATFTPAPTIGPSNPPF